MTTDKPYNREMLRERVSAIIRRKDTVITIAETPIIESGSGNVIYHGLAELNWTTPSATAMENHHKVNLEFDVTGVGDPAQPVITKVELTGAAYSHETGLSVSFATPLLIADNRVEAKLSDIIAGKHQKEWVENFLLLTDSIPNFIKVPAPKKQDEQWPCEATITSTPWGEVDMKVKRTGSNCWDTNWVAHRVELLCNTIEKQKARGVELVVYGRDGSLRVQDLINRATYELSGDTTSVEEAIKAIEWDHSTSCEK